MSVSPDVFRAAVAHWRAIGWEHNERVPSYLTER